MKTKFLKPIFWALLSIGLMTATADAYNSGASYAPGIYPDSGGNVTLTGGLTIGAASSFQFLGRTKLTAGADGNWIVSNNAVTDFGRLMFGGNTAAFPSIKRTSTGIDVMLADLSGAAPITSSNLTSSTSRGQLFGSTTNDAATAGNIGEFITSTVTKASPVALVNGTSKTITSISLTAGDWDVFVMGGFTGAAGTTVFHLNSSISTTTDTESTTEGRFANYVNGGGAIFGNGDPILNAIVPTRISLSSTTTVYLVANASFLTSTCSGYGIISARRVR